MIRYKLLCCKYFHNHQFFYLRRFQCNKYQFFCMNFCVLLVSKVSNIDHVIQKLICSIFHVHAFNICSHFICLVNQFFNTRTIFIFNNVFTRIYVCAVNKISTNSNVYCKNHWKYHNIQFARTAFIFMIIFIFKLF